MEYRRTSVAFTVVSALLVMGLAVPVLAEEPAKLPTIDVIGSTAEALDFVPGSGQVITREELETFKPLSSQDALRRVPGVNIVETEGYGFHPRIGVRGLNPDMSRKVLLLEDGAPIALGPYTDPSSYYSPPIERMERVEVLKGSGSLRYGPSTIGGAINYVTKNPPYEPGGSVTLTGGNRGYRSVLAEYGGTWDNAMGSISYLRKEGDGARQNNEFRVDDVVVKGGFGIGHNQFVGAKITYYDRESQNTYLGLTQREFEETPRMNRAANDRMEVKRYSVDLNHEIHLTPNLTWSNLIYFNNAVRDWWREGHAFDAATGYNVMQGNTGGRLREWYIMGADSRLELAYDTFGIYNEAEFGVRVHSEEMTNQRIDGVTPTDRSGTIREDDLREAEAVAFFLQNRFHITDRFAVTPGLRVESYRQERTIHRWANARVEESAKTSNTEWVPGIGATYAFHDGAILFGGVHRGFAPPRVADAVSNVGEAVDLNAERSTNYEIGLRGRLPRLTYEITGFRYDFSNQIIQSSESGGAAGNVLTNAGETLNQGFEIGVGVDLLWGFGLDANWTHVATAKLDSTRIIGGIDRKGNRLPYAPKNVANAALTYRQGPVRAAVHYQYVDEQFSDFANTVEGSPNGRTGIIPSYSVWNLSGDYQLTPSIALEASVKNLLDKDYISSRAPEGIFTGTPRLVMAGVRMAF